MPYQVADPAGWRKFIRGVLIIFIIKLPKALILHMPLFLPLKDDIANVIVELVLAG